MKKVLFAIMLSILFSLMLGMTAVFAQEYYVSNSGDDNNKGTSPEQSWKSVSKVNNHEFSADDVINFKSGDMWREQLLPTSGNSSGSITYTSYGTGEKPAFLGSISKNNQSDWVNNGNNIWTLNLSDNRIVSKQKISVDDADFWVSDQATADKIITDTDNQKAIELSCSDSGFNHSDIQIILNGIKIESGKSYIFSYKAKSSIGIKLTNIALMKSDSPWTEYFSFSSDSSARIDHEWKTYSVLYKSETTDNDARITIYAGGDLPNGSKLYLSSLSISEINDSKIYNDVGNIIFDNGKSCGIKVFNRNELTSQNKFYYNENKKTIEMYSVKNPAELYSSIECALEKDIINIDNKSYIQIDGLSLRYGGAHGIGGTNTFYISITNCDIAYIGGGKQYEKNGEFIRYGNGIEFWDDAHDNLVDGCKIYEIYDAAVTNQGNGDGNKQYNITYSNNTIWNSEYSFEYWNSSKTGVTHDIYFKNNVCKDAGYGWGHSQRPDKSGMHISFCNNLAATSGVYIINNVFANSTNCTLYVAEKWNGIETLHINNNKYTQAGENNFAAWRDSGTYSAYEFASYQKTSGADNSSVILYADIENREI